jgi:hypothetical protein
MGLRAALCSSPSARTHSALSLVHRLAVAVAEGAAEDEVFKKSEIRQQTIGSIAVRESRQPNISPVSLPKLTLD